MNPPAPVTNTRIAVPNVFSPLQITPQIRAAIQDWLSRRQGGREKAFRLTTRTRPPSNLVSKQS